MTKIQSSRHGGVRLGEMERVRARVIGVLLISIFLGELLHLGIEASTEDVQTIAQRAMEKDLFFSFIGAAILEVSERRYLKCTRQTDLVEQ